MQEQISIKRSRSGTTAYFFNTDINESNYATSTVPAIVRLNSNLNVPIELNSFDGASFTGNSHSVLWERSGENEYQNTASQHSMIPQTNPHGKKTNFITAATQSNYVTGRTFSQTYQNTATDINKIQIRNRFTASMSSMFTAGTITYVFFEDTLIDDIFANVKLERSFDILNTLDIYNKVDGEYSYRESSTGVVFGKLEAIQKIVDEEGNKIRIPLRNVPIGVFNQSNDFPTPNSVDENGDRIRLNFKTRQSNGSVSINPSNYFNAESAALDDQFLKKYPLEGLNSHPTFKNIVYTNDNGEFILNEIPTGAQVLFFEVDLLKQGLTKDEVALNFFPYPPSFENVSIDSIPHYFYRAIPIDVTPSWGTSFLTGYTEVDISVNLDLRKWATYIFPPVTYSGLTTDSPEYFNISRAPMTVKVRDMSKFDQVKALNKDPETYPSQRIQMVEIQNFIDKNSDQQWDWANEFSQIKDKAMFQSFGHHAIKLPANIYDANGYKTDFGGTKMINSYSKGVWLCGYQLKLYLNHENNLYRTTGLAFDWNGENWYSRDHFHCCLYDNIAQLITLEPTGTTGYKAAGAGIGKFPYEKAWSKTYPSNYSIPRKPSQEIYPNNRFYIDNPYMESPRFSDGEIIYGDTYMGFNGFGASFGGQVWQNYTQPTSFATDVIGGEGADMYKYEPIGMGIYGQNNFFGCYVNGYCNQLDADLGYSGHSEVVSAETYQRLEAGYGYFLPTSSMPRIVPYSWFFDAFMAYETIGINTATTQSVQNESFSQKSEFGVSAVADHHHSYSVLDKGKNISIDLGVKYGEKPITSDKLNIYRIINGKNKIAYDFPVKLNIALEFVLNNHFTGTIIDENGNSHYYNDNIYTIVYHSFPENTIITDATPGTPQDPLQFLLEIDSIWYLYGTEISCSAGSVVILNKIYNKISIVTPDGVQRIYDLESMITDGAALTAWNMPYQLDTNHNSKIVFKFVCNTYSTGNAISNGGSDSNPDNFGG